MPAHVTLSPNPRVRHPRTPERYLCRITNGVAAWLDGEPVRVANRDATQASSRMGRVSICRFGMPLMRNRFWLCEWPRDTLTDTVDGDDLRRPGSK